MALVYVASTIYDLICGRIEQAMFSGIIFMLTVYIVGFILRESRHAMLIEKYDQLVEGLKNEISLQQTIMTCDNKMFEKLLEMCEYAQTLDDESKLQMFGQIQECISMTVEKNKEDKQDGKSKFFVKFPDGTRKEAGLDLSHAGTYGMPVLQDPNRIHLLHVDLEPMTYTFTIDLNDRLRRELLTELHDKSLRRRYAALCKGIRLLKMWQNEWQPHRKRYYRHISDLKLASALANDIEVKFSINDKRFRLTRDELGSVRIYKGE